MPPITFNFKNQVAKEQESMIQQVNRILSLPQCNLYVLFDDQDLKWGQYQQPDGTYTNVKLEKEKDDIPGCIREIIEKEKCDHFIWISNKICISNSIHLAWTYAHELQHLKQHLQNPTLGLLNEFFTLCVIRYLFEPDAPSKELITIPLENDAERAAKRAVTQIFGEDACTEYIEYRKDYKSLRWYEIIPKIDINEKYDVETETIRYLCEHKRWFTEKQTDFDNTLDIKKFDFDEICQKKKIPLLEPEIILP